MNQKQLFWRISLYLVRFSKGSKVGIQVRRNLFVFSLAPFPRRPSAEIQKGKVCLPINNHENLPTKGSLWFINLSLGLISGAWGCNRGGGVPFDSHDFRCYVSFRRGKLVNRKIILNKCLDRWYVKFFGRYHGTHASPPKKPGQFKSRPQTRRVVTPNSSEK